jgi:hypothetical protein
MADTDKETETTSADAPAPQTEETVMPKDTVTPDGNDVFPISCKRFVATLVHTHNEVYAKLLFIEHGRENHTVDDWYAIIGDHAVKPAHPSAM